MIIGPFFRKGIYSILMSDNWDSCLTTIRFLDSTSKCNRRIGAKEHLVGCLKTETLPRTIVQSSPYRGDLLLGDFG
jgi:hypothetical protein